MQLWALPEGQARTGAEFEAHLARTLGADDGAEPADSGEEPGADAAAAFSEDARSGAAEAGGGRGAAGPPGQQVGPFRMWRLLLCSSSCMRASIPVHQ